MHRKMLASAIWDRLIIFSNIFDVDMGEKSGDFDTTYS
jgi:hypothetical protein